MFGSKITFIIMNNDSIRNVTYYYIFVDIESF